MHKIIRLFRILFENLFINYKKYDKDFKLETNDTLVSFNIRADHPRDNKTNWVYRRNAISDFIKDKKPSIICMQEVLPSMFKWLYKRLYNQYGFIECSGNKKHTSLFNTINIFKNGMVIWYDKTKMTLIQQKIVLVDHNNPEKFFLMAHFKMNDGKIITVINTHYDCNYAGNRQMMTNVINKILSSINNTIYLCGDFNASIKNAELQSIDLNYHVPFDNETQRTFNHFDDTHAIIDFVFSDNEMTYEICTKDYGVPYISDHYPIIVKLC